MKSIYDCEIITQTTIAPNVVRTLLTGPEIAREARAGQFLNVQVARTTDPLLRRPFSVHAVYPKEGTYSLLYVMVGRGTFLLNQIQPGAKVSVVGPLGKPFDLGEAPGAHHVVVAGGCGAAPLHFLCDALCKKWGCGTVEVLLGAQSKQIVLCEDEFRAHGVDVAVSTDDGSYGYKGGVTDLLADRLAKLAGARVRVYSCGPHPMMKAVAEVSRRAGVESCQVSLENNMACGIGVCTGCVQKVKGAARGDDSGRDWRHERVCADGPVFDAESIIWD